jgi:hypothetical protein
VIFFDVRPRKSRNYIRCRARSRRHERPVARIRRAEHDGLALLLLAGGGICQPSWQLQTQDLALELAHADLNELLASAGGKFPTGAMASFRFDGAWKALEPHGAVLAEKRASGN